MAGSKTAKNQASRYSAINKALHFLTVTLLDQIASHVPDHDDLDALVSASALRALHDPQHIFRLEDAVEASAMREGWIFGVTSPKTSS